MEGSFGQSSDGGFIHTRIHRTAVNQYTGKYTHQSQAKVKNAYDTACMPVDVPREPETLNIILIIADNNNG